MQKLQWHVEREIAIRQLATKTMKSKSWFIQVPKILNKYNLTDPHTLLDSPPKKRAWSDEVKSAIEYWEKELADDAKTKNSLKCLNVNAARHHVWLTVDPSTWATCKAVIKARLLKAHIISKPIELGSTCTLWK